MRKKLALATAGLVAVYLLALLRWHIVVGADNSMVVYRLDSFTGRVEMSLAGGEWKRIESPVFNSWGDQLVR